MLRFLVVLALFSLCVVANAQDWVEHDGAEYNCRVLNGILADYGDSDLSRSGDSVMTVREWFALMLQNCPPNTDTATSETPVEIDASSSHTLFSFSSDEHGLQPVLGPLAFPAGMYVATLTTEDYMTVDSEVISGECGSDLSYFLIGISAGEGTKGAQNVFEVESDCTVMFDVGLVGETWTLEVISAYALTSFSTSDSYSFNSDNEGLQPVLGPISILKGHYIVTATTEGYMIVDSKILSGECGSDLSYSLIGISAGEGAKGAQNVFEVESDCLVLFDVGLSDEDWTLEIERVS